MNSIDVKTEKANAISRYQKFQRITIIFRFMEILVFVIVISRFLTQFPFTVRVSVDQFRGISFAFFSPRLVFVIGNVIILILLFKSRVVDNGDYDGRIKVYDEYVKRCEKNVVNNSCISTIKERKICRSRSENLVRVDQTDRKLRRSVTEKIAVKKVDCGGGDGGSETVAPEKSCPADELSSDEFRRTVEAFIARQQRSLRDEELATVPCIGV